MRGIPRGGKFSGVVSRLGRVSPVLLETTLGAYFGSADERLG